MRSSYNTCPRCGFCSLEKYDSKSFHSHGNLGIQQKSSLAKKVT